MRLSTYKEKYHFAINFYSIFLLITFIPDFLAINSEIFKNFYWIIKISLAVWIIYKTKFIFDDFNTLEILFLLVTIIYIINLYYDVFIEPKPFLKKDSGILDLIGLIIAVVIALSFRNFPELYSKKSYIFLWITLSIGLIIAYFYAKENISLDVSNIRYDANSNVNSINYGQAGCALSLLSLYGFFNAEKRNYKILFILSFLIGLISIAKAGSRSPLVVISIVSAIFFISKLGTIKSVIILTILAVIFTFSIDIIVQLSEYFGSSLATRVTNSITENDSSGRDMIWSNVINIINESPIFGSYYLIPSGIGMRGYPHNFFLEIFMATGVIGGIPFVILVVASIIKGYNLMKKNHGLTWIVILYFQILIFGMFSSGLYTSQDFWILLFLLISIKENSATIDSDYQESIKNASTKKLKTMKTYTV